MVHLLARGGHSSVFIARVNNDNAAIKISTLPQLVRCEAEVMQLLAQKHGFPTLIASDKQHFIVMELLGPSLADLRSTEWTRSTFASVALQVIDRVETLHASGLIHRDIKPHNFAMGRGQAEHIIYMIDFGVAKRYVNETNKLHIFMHTDCEHLVGTRRYCSSNSHLRRTLSRRDDLESMGYTLAEILLGTLPWAYLQDETRLLKAKLQPACSWCPQLADLLTYTRSLAFEKQPDYERCRTMVRNLCAE